MCPVILSDLSCGISYCFKKANTYIFSVFCSCQQMHYLLYSTVSIPEASLVSLTQEVNYLATVMASLVLNRSVIGIKFMYI